MPFRDGDDEEGSMVLEVKQVKPGDTGWSSMAGLFPSAVRWMDDPTDEDPSQEDPERQYTVVAINSAKMRDGQP